MDAAQLAAPRLPPGTLVLTPELSFSLTKADRNGLAKFGAYNATQDTRFRDFSTGGFSGNSRPEADYFPRQDRAKFVARSRIAFRNNPYLAAGVRAYVLELGTPTLKSQTDDAAYNDAKERYFESWAGDCEIENNLSLDQVVEIYHYESAVGGGELFVVKQSDGRIQLIASELCGTAGTTKQQPVWIPGAPRVKFADGSAVPAGSTERDGIVRDSGRRIIGYRFGSRDEQGAISFAPERSSIVQSRFVYHLFDPDRVEMGRGIPLALPVMNAFQDAFETAEARAQQVKNASCLSMWVTKNIDPYGYAESMRGAIRGDSLANVGALKTIAEARSGYQEIKKGAIYYGAPGESVTLIEPKINAGDFHQHYIDLLQVCFACFNGMPIEIALEGFRSSSYSSSRATMNKWKRNVLRSRKLLAGKFLDPVQLWQSERARIFGVLASAPVTVDGKPAAHNTDEDVFWGWPPVPDIDGLKTAEQGIKELSAGMTTYEELYAAKGQHSDVQLRRFVKEKTALAKSMREAALAAGLSQAAADQIAAGYLANAESSVVPATSTIDDEPAPAAGANAAPA